MSRESYIFSGFRKKTMMPPVTCRNLYDRYSRWRIFGKHPLTGKPFLITFTSYLIASSHELPIHAFFRNPFPDIHVYPFPGKKSGLAELSTYGDNDP